MRSEIEKRAAEIAFEIRDCNKTIAGASSRKKELEKELDKMMDEEIERARRG